MGKTKRKEINESYFILGFFEFEFSPDIITTELNLEPSEQGVKGDEYFVGSQKLVGKTHEYNMWIYEEEIVSNEYIGNLIKKFIQEVLVPRTDKIKKLMTKGNVQLRVVQYVYDTYNPQYYFRREDLKVLAEINSSIDMDLYCLAK